VKRYDKITEAGIHEVVLFHSTVEELKPHALDLPFPVAADACHLIFSSRAMERL
jgi:hypothetical protein